LTISRQTDGCPRLLAGEKWQKGTSYHSNAPTPINRHTRELEVSRTTQGDRDTFQCILYTYLERTELSYSKPGRLTAIWHIHSAFLRRMRAAGDGGRTSRKSSGWRLGTRQDYWYHPDPLPEHRALVGFQNIPAFQQLIRGRSWQSIHHLRRLSR